MQDRQIAYIRKLGFEVFVIDSLEGVKEFIKKIGGGIK